MSLLEALFNVLGDLGLGNDNVINLNVYNININPHLQYNSIIADTYGELFNGTRTFNVAEGGMKILEFVFDLLNGLLGLGNLLHLFNDHVHAKILQAKKKNSQPWLRIG